MAVAGVEGGGGTGGGVERVSDNCEFFFSSSGYAA